MANKKPEDCSICFTPAGDKCVPINTPACDKYRNAGSGAKNITFQQLAARYAIANDPNQIRQLLVTNKLVANTSVANSLTNQQIENLLLAYYNNNGKSSFANLMNQFRPNGSTKNWTTDPNILIPAYNDLIKTVPQALISSQAQEITTFGLFDSCDICNKLFKGIVGGSETTTTPIVQTTTKASPVTIGLIIGGVLVLGILAYVVVKS